MIKPIQDANGLAQLVYAGFSDNNLKKNGVTKNLL
jgi:hypothetical protein